MSEAVTALLEGRLQEQLLRLQQTLCQGALPAAAAELSRLQALACWQHTSGTAKQLALLARALGPLVKPGSKPHSFLLPHAFRLLHTALGPDSRQALLLARLPPANTAQGKTLRHFLLGLPTTHASRNKTQARAQLRQYLQHALGELADACCQGPWTLQNCVAAGRAQSLRRMTRLATFLAHEETETFARLELLVLLLHLQHSSSDSDENIPGPALQKLLWRLSLGRPVQTSLQALLAPLLSVQGGENSLMNAMDADREEVQQGLQVLQDWHRSTAHTCDGSLHVSEAVLFESAQLGWVLLALDAPLAGALLQLMHRVFTDYWYLHRPLPDLLTQQLDELLDWLASGRWQICGTDPQCVLIGKWLGTLLEAWPQQAGIAEGRLLKEVRVQDADGQLLPPSLPTELPAQLAARLRVIPALEPGWCRDPEGWQAEGAELVGELVLLEQGAAALRLAALERYCACLLEVLHLLPLHPAFPATLLQEARECLLHMLDRAALWLAPEPDESHLGALQRWLQELGTGLPQVLQDCSCVGSEYWLRLEIEHYLRPAAAILDRSLRVQIAAMTTLPDQASWAALVQALQVLLRWLLRCSEADTGDRRDRGLPQALRLTLRIENSADTAWQLQLFDAGGTLFPDQRQLRRLARKAGVAELRCRIAEGEGRHFSLVPHSRAKPV